MADRRHAGGDVPDPHPLHRHVAALSTSATAGSAACFGHRVRDVGGKGDIYYGLWYPIVIAVMSLIIGMIFLKETKNNDVHTL